MSRHPSFRQRQWEQHSRLLTRSLMRKRFKRKPTERMRGGGIRTWFKDAKGGST